MKLGVIVGVNKYSGSGLSDLPGCVQDASLIQTILQSQEEYHEILTLTANANSAEVKQQLIDFVGKHKGEEISEFVFYFTGHGVFKSNEYYYLFSDYQSTKLRQTALENTELDNLIRSLNPKLTTKIVDSCQSGLPYIKDSNEIDTYLKGTQSGFQNCYFLFSSRTDESSYQDNVLSAFTKAVGELIASRTGIVRHKDIIDYVSDSFTANAKQTPFFVVQADFTDQFCKVDVDLQNQVALILSNSNKQPLLPTAPMKVAASLKAIVEDGARFYCTKEEASAVLSRLSERVSTYQPPGEAKDLYRPEMSVLTDYTGVPNLEAIGNWLQEAKHSFFAEPTYKKVKERHRKLGSLATIGLWAIQGGTSRDDEYEDVIVNRLSGARSTTEMPYAGLALRATPLYPNLDSTACYLVPFISRTHVLLFAGFASYVARGWGQEVLAGEIKWRASELPMKDGVCAEKAALEAVDEFWNFTIKLAKRKFGLDKEDSEPESQEQGGKKTTEEKQETQTTKKAVTNKERS